MPDFDLILLGETAFTIDLKSEFEGKVKLLFVDNTAFKKEFSTELFPEVTYIPQTKQIEGLFGQVISESFRVDLSSKRNIFNLMWTEELKEKIEKLDLLEKSAAFELNIANYLMLESFAESMFSTLIKNINFTFKNLSQIRKLYLHRLSNGIGEFKNFITTLRLFLAPGEVNNAAFDKYIFYSFISKQPYKIEEELFVNSSKNDAGLLVAITHGENWELRFEKQKVTGKILVSGIPPHIFNICDISHPFELGYHRAFFCLTPVSPLEPSPMMADELVYANKDRFCFIKKQKNKGLHFFVPAKISEKLDLGVLEDVFDSLFPHVINLPQFNVLSHIYPVYDSFKNKKFAEEKTVYFLKNFEYPFLGIDGEMLYRKKLKETLWKKLL